MKTIVVLLGIMILGSSVIAQKFITKNGHIKFYSETPIETIEAHNRQVNTALDSETGDFVFKVLMKSFEFEKALMQEHFNENYVESDTYPNAMFKGKVKNLDEINFSVTGEYEAAVEGELTIHGVTQKISANGLFTIAEGMVKGESTFIIRPEDYKISIPKTVINNIAEEIQVTVVVDLKEYKK
ncbi:MAG: YceI family protein [Bacteroidales bacterium]|nr:YceI family protein [Bacteroidales bacterium]MCF8403139.1 YceI family protein [Bacteroidales bacterium]